jgi:hypothetical protein
MKVGPDGDGVRIRVGIAEADTLSSLVADLVKVLRPGGLDSSDPVHQRLFPDGYRDDPQAAAAFRSLTEQGLRTDRLHRAEQCLTELSGAAARRRRLDVRLGPESAQRWIQVLNDMRLAIGTRLGVKDDEHAYDVDPHDPEAMPWAIYAYLTGVQDSVVQALMR